MVIQKSGDNTVQPAYLMMQGEDPVPPLLLKSIAILYSLRGNHNQFLQFVLAYFQPTMNE